MQVFELIICPIPTDRPLSQQETKDKVPVICKVDEKKKEVAVQMKASNQSKTFAFDAAYGPTSTQQEIFEVYYYHFQFFRDF